MDIKVGDIVHIRGRVLHLSNTPQYVNYIGCAIGEPSSPIWIPKSEIIHVEPCPLKVGDRVITDFGYFGTILAINDDVAWIKFEIGVYTTRKLSELRHAP
jgi:hypothetical protein